MVNINKSIDLISTFFRRLLQRRSAIQNLSEIQVYTILCFIVVFPKLFIFIAVMKLWIFVWLQGQRTTTWRLKDQNPTASKCRDQKAEVPRPKNHDIEVPRPKKHDIEFPDSNPCLPWHHTYLRYLSVVTQIG